MRELRGDWRDIFNGFSVALDLKKLLAGFLAICLTIIIGVAGPFFAACLFKPDGSQLWNRLIKGDFVEYGNLYNAAWHIIFDQSLALIILIVVVTYLLLAIVWAYFGGFITRTAAINLTKDEGLEANKALAFTNKKFLAYLSPCIICILGFLFFAFCNFMGGLAGRIPYVGELLIAIFLPFAILSGFIMVFIIIGSVFGSPLFYPTIGVEGSDSFDAMSRSFSYLYSRPWHYIFYQASAFVYGVLTTAFVWLFGCCMVRTALWAGELGLGSEKFGSIVPVRFESIFSWPIFMITENTSVTQYIAAFVIGVWLIIIFGFIAAYIVSYFFSAQTAIYLILRKKVDDIDVKEVFEEKEEEEISTPTSSESPKPIEEKKTEAEEKPTT